MNINFKRSYRKKGTGNTVFVYAVSGTPAELEAFKKAQGEFFIEDEDGTPLWFTTRFVGKSGKLVITSAGKVIADMSQFDQMASLAQQYGGNLGEALAQQAAGALLGVTPVVAPVQATEQGSIDNL
jgi:hypothetical protein